MTFAFPKFDSSAFLWPNDNNLEPCEYLDSLAALGDDKANIEQKVLSLSSEDRFWYAERAAIIQYDGNIPEEKAKQQAYLQLLKYKQESRESNENK